MLELKNFQAVAIQGLPKAVFIKIRKNIIMKIIYRLTSNTTFQVNSYLFPTFYFLIPTFAVLAKTIKNNNNRFIRINKGYRRMYHLTFSFCGPFHMFQTPDTQPHKKLSRIFINSVYFFCNITKQRRISGIVLTVMNAWIQPKPATLGHEFSTFYLIFSYI